MPPRAIIPSCQRYFFTNGFATVSLDSQRESHLEVRLRAEVGLVWPHLASTEAIQGVSQVPGWRPLPPKNLVSQVAAAACRATGIWQVRKQGVMLPRLLAGAPASGSGDADCLSALAPWEAHLPNPVLLKK